MNTASHETKHRCACGRFDTRRIKVNPKQKTMYVVPTKISTSKTGCTPTFKMKYAYDGLCERCHAQGVPEYTKDELRDIETNKNRGVGFSADSRRAINKIAFKGGM